MKRIAAISCLAFGLSACGGGGASGPGAPMPKPTSGAAAGSLGSIAFTISVPQARTQSTGRRADYISYQTQSVSITPQGGPTQVFLTGQSAPRCTIVSGAIVRCTFTATVPTGPNIPITIATYHNTIGYGTPISLATITVTVIPGQSNPVTATLNGVVDRLDIAVSPARITPGTPTDVSVTVTAYDRFGQAIIGPGMYADSTGKILAIALGNTDPTGSTTLSQASVNQPTPGLVLKYNGSSAFQGTTVSAGAPTATLSANIPTGSIVEYATPTSNSGPSGITKGPDGNIWFVEYLQSKIGRITPSGSVTEFTAPTNLPPSGSITTGPDGNLWYTDLFDDKIGRMTPSGTFTGFPIPTAKSGVSTITSGPDGNMWFTEHDSNKIGRMTLSGVVTEFAIPTASSGPLGIVAGPDGNLWFCESKLDAVGKIGRITPSGAFTEFSLPTAYATQEAITVGPDGNLWFTEFRVNQIGRITTSGVATEFPLPGSFAVPTDIVTGPDGNLWFPESDYSTNRIGRMTPSGAVTEFPIPTAYAVPVSIAAGADGYLWFTEKDKSKIGRVTP